MGCVFSLQVCASLPTDGTYSKCKPFICTILVTGHWNVSMFFTPTIKKLGGICYKHCSPELALHRISTIE